MDWNDFLLNRCGSLRACKELTFHQATGYDCFIIRADDTSERKQKVHIEEVKSHLASMDHTVVTALLIITRKSLPLLLDCLVILPHRRNIYSSREKSRNVQRMLRQAR